MDKENSPGIKGYKDQQENLKAIMKSPAVEAFQKQQDQSNRIIGVSPNIKHNTYQRVSSLMGNPVFQDLQRYQDTWSRILNLSASVGVEKFQSIASTVHNPSFDYLINQQNFFVGLVNNPTFELIQRQHDTWNRLLGGVSVFAGLEKHQYTFNKFSIQTLSNYQNVFSQAQKSLNLNILQTYNHRWNDLMKKVSHLGINSNTISELVDELHEVNDAIDSSSSINEDTNNTNEIKIGIQKVIAYLRDIMAIVSVVDTNFIWDILTKISVLITILNPLMPVEEKDKVQVINVNGDNTVINIENNDSGSIIINNLDNKDIDVHLKKNGAMTEREIKIKEQQKVDIEEVDISAGQRI